MSGRALSQSAVTELEQLLLQNPSDLRARTKLLGFYSEKQFDSVEAKSRKAEHTLWILGHAPASAIASTPYVRLETDPKAYAKAKEVWMAHLQGTPRVEVLENAAWFFSRNDKSLAEELWARARAVTRGN